MVQSLELVLDETSEAAVRDQWRRLAEAGLPSLAHHQGASNRPHVTLDARDRAGDDDRLGRAGLPLPVALRLGGPLLFGTRRGWVLTRHVVVTTELVALHGRALDLLGAGTSPLTASDAWVPHVTLAHGLQPEQVALALEVLGPDPSLAAVGRAARRWDSETRRVWTVAGVD